MRKIFLIVFPFLVVFFFLVAPTYACTITTFPGSFKPDYYGSIKLNSLGDKCDLDTEKTYTIFAVPQGITDGGRYANYSVDRRVPQDKSTIVANLNLLQGSIGKNNSGIWTIGICSITSPLSSCANPNNIVGTASILVDSFQETASPTDSQPASLSCAKFDASGKKCIVVDSAIGQISAEPQAFVRFIYSVVLGLAGGIALIMIIISGYKFMASQGNPEAIKGATEGLTSAIIGLLFIIFAFVILQIIGVDILQIPGFK